MRPFGYWRDGLFLIGCALYALNRWAIKPWTTSPFLHGYFNDVLLIPCALPLVLWMQRKLGARTHDRPPTMGEVAAHLAVWSVLFEVAGPHLMHVTGDPRDVLAYAAGGALSSWWWNTRRPTAGE